MTIETTPQQPTGHTEILTPAPSQPKRKAPPPIKFPQFEEHIGLPFSPASPARDAGRPPRAKRPTHADVFQRGLDLGRDEGYRAGFQARTRWDMFCGAVAGFGAGVLLVAIAIKLGMVST